MKAIVYYPSEKSYEFSLPDSFSSINWALNYIYQETQHADWPTWIQGKKIRSSSVGDVFAINERYFIVDSVGFREISKEIFERWNKLTFRDTIMGFEWCVKQGLI